MRAFWTFISVLVLAAGGLVLKEFRSGSRTTAGAVQETAEGDARAETVDPGPTPRVDAPGPAGDRAEGELTDPVAVIGSPPARGEVGEDPIVVGVGVADENPGDVEAAGDPVPRADDGAVESLPVPAAATDAEPVASLVLNDRYTVTGSGTAEDPYAIDFDMLVALEQDYEPKTAGKTEVPGWIRPLDGAHVVITGFIGFPFIAPTADECMVMLNQWDGCCIGVPPTPYDAVEVQLAEPIDLQGGVVNYGTLTGVFRTDPYLVNGWLIGLYVMEEARLESGGSKNQAGF